MITFDVQGMTCGHCTKAITQAVLAVDAAAKVQVDLPSQRVQIESVAADPELSQAIVQVGYSPVLLTGEPAISTPAKKAGGCCCS